MERVMNANVDVWTDGACSGNPGPIGYAAVIHDGEKQFCFVDGADNGTNNEAELLAVLLAVKHVHYGCRVVIHTDSRNAIGWLSDGWKCKTPGLAAIIGDIRKVIAERRLRVTYELVAGHAGVDGNERADRLASGEAQARRTALAQGAVQGPAHIERGISHA